MPWDENPEFLERHGWQLVRSSAAATALLVVLLATWSADIAILALILFPGVLLVSGTAQYVVRVSVPVIFVGFRGKTHQRALQARIHERTADDARLRSLRIR